MTAYDVSPSPSPGASGQEPHRRPRQDHSMPGSTGYETGESSTPGGLASDANVIGSSLAPRPSDDPPASSPAARPHHSSDGPRRENRIASRSHKHRSSGAFLLTDALDDGHHEPSRSLRRSHHAPLGQRPTSATHTPDRRLPPNASTHADPSPVHQGPEQDGSPPAEHEEANGTFAGKQTTGPGTAATDLPPGDADVGFDMDSAQIVNMALNLSESRRLAAKRNVSQPHPPRLAPLPDSTVGGSLRQQLQQQRRSSRTVSPKPERGSRISSGLRLSSPLAASFEQSDGAYRYHFSQSTLARAQKAKDHLELLAQYRRVLDLVPPLRPTAPSKGHTAGHQSSAGPSGPAHPGGVDFLPSLGRQYNPLQYIRNRKVRARERRTIDGDGDGFGDTLKVGEWVDEVAKWAATGQSRTPGSALLPPFSASGDLTLQRSSSTGSRGVPAPTRPKRPRVDWLVNPTDMLADIYWLEQDDNKRLVEDRHWRRVFPQDSGLYRPLSRHSDDAVLVDSRPGSLRQGEEEVRPDASGSDQKRPAKAEHEQVRSSARERARQKLKDLRGHHHRQSSSVQAHDLFSGGRASFSDSSDTDGDPRRRSRAGTATDQGRSLLEKQMAEMIAREHQDAGVLPPNDPDSQRGEPNHPSLMTPERPKHGDPLAPGHRHSRRGSRAEYSESDELSSRGRPHVEPPIKPGRVSLEVPTVARRMSLDYDSSRPTSPELRPARDAGFVPAIGADLSPASSRPGSPSRNRFSKMKSMFRDRSRERAGDRGSEERDAPTHTPGSLPEPSFGTPPTPQERNGSRVRRSSRSPRRHMASTGTGDTHRSHRSFGSTRLHREESGGLRNFFRGGPRIDTVLRTGVSKVSDLFWRRESAETADLDTSSTSSDESETEAARGRPPGSARHRRAESRSDKDGHAEHQSKHFLDVMPLFASGSSHGKKATGEHKSASSPYSPSRPSSQRSSRFELLKPPKLDLETASPTTPPRRARRRGKDSDKSDTDSRKSSHGTGHQAASARLHAVLGRTPPFPLPAGRHFSNATAFAGRHVSLSHRSPSPVRTALSRREVARFQAMMLSSGILARELSCRARTPRVLLPPPASDAAPPPSDFSWAEITRFAPSEAVAADLAARPVARVDLHPLAAHLLAASAQSSARAWQTATEAFSATTAPALRAGLDALRAGGAVGPDGTRAAADEADAVDRDLATAQRLKLRRVVDGIEKLHRRRRRRFRWVRRAGWLAVEWVLVGFMWYVWFVVMIARVFLGLGEGMFRGLRWLLWL